MCIRDSFDSHRRVILAGDLNCNHHVWNSRLTTPNGKRLLIYVESRRATVVGPAQPTFFQTLHNAAPDVLDIAVTQGIVCLVEVFPFTKLTSDHNPILVHVVTQHAYARVEKKVIDWERYGPALYRRLPPADPLDSCLLYTSRCV